jgi:molybdopterin converting factor subunit 1
MRCTILFFAHVRDTVGTDREEITLRDGATVQDALGVIIAQHAAVAPMADRLAVAVNEKYCARNTPLPDGCTIALIPPVSGG